MTELQRRPIGAPKLEEPEPQMPPSTDRYVVVPIELVQGLLKYLDTMPHGQARPFVDGLIMASEVRE